MKSFLKSMPLVALIAFPAVAFAQSSPTDMSNFSFRLKLQTRFDITDSYRQNQGDLISTTARMGLNYKYKNVFGVIEFQGGSASDAYTQSTVSSTPTDNGTQELFVVRRANVGLDIVKSDPVTVSFLIGRDHNTSSIVYAPDGLVNLTATNIDNISAANSQDGVAVKYKGGFDFGTIDGAIGYYNNYPVAVLAGGGTTATQTSPFSTSSIGTADSTYNSQTKTQSRAIAAQIGANIKVADGVVEGRALYSTQPNAVTKVQAASPTYSSRDTSNFEASVGYNYKANELKGGIWVQSVTLGKTQNSGANSITTNNVTYIDGTTDDSYTVNTYGLGVTGKSTLFGISNLLADGDVLTYGVGYQMSSGQNFTGGGGSTGVTAFSNTSVTTSFFNIAAGYAQGAFSIELDYVMANADKEIYAGSDGIPNEKQANLIYLVGTIVL